MNTEKTIYVLKALIELNNDRIEGYETVSKETSQPDLKALFYELILTSRQCKQELANEVRRIVGMPIEDPNTTGSFLKAWMDFKSALTNYNRKEILNLSEFGAEAAVDTYIEVINNNHEHLSAEQQAILQTQRTLLKADRYKVKALRDNLQEAI